MRELLEHVSLSTAIERRAKTPKTLNPLDSAPLNSLERHAIKELVARKKEGDESAAVLLELIHRSARALESYQSHYPAPI